MLTIFTPCSLAVLLLATVLAGPARAQAPALTGRTASGIWYSVRGSGPPLVLLHGSNLDGRSFDAMAPALAERYRVVTPDLRLHGRTTDPGGPVRHGADLLELLDTLGLERAALLGHSMGAQVALDFALDHPSRVERLILLTPWVSGVRPTAMPEGIDSVMAAARRGDPEGAARAMAAMPSMRLVARPDRQGDATALIVANAGLFAQDPRRLVAPAPAADRLDALRAPLLLIQPAADLTESPRMAALLRERVPGARLVEIPGCGHLAPLDCPDAVARAVLAWR